MFYFTRTKINRRGRFICTTTIIHEQNPADFPNHDLIALLNFYFQPKPFFFILTLSFFLFQFPREIPNGIPALIDLIYNLIFEFK